MISRYNQHSPHSAQLLTEQVPLDAKRSLNVGFVLLLGIRDLSNTKRLSKLHPQSLYAAFGQKLVDFRPRFVACIAKCLSKFVDLAAAPCDGVVDVVNHRALDNLVPKKGKTNGNS